MNNTKWFQNPEMVIALSALLIGLVTAAVSIYSAYIDREYAKASVWPKLEIFRNTQSDSFAYQVLNSGTGPAIIQYGQVEHNEISMKTPQSLLSSMNLCPLRYVITRSILNVG